MCKGKGNLEEAPCPMRSKRSQQRVLRSPNPEGKHGVCDGSRYLDQSP